MPRVAVVLMTLLLVSCADDEPVETGAPRSPDPDQRFEVSTTILESPEHGPQLCLGGQATSYPPQCGGPDVIGWDWTAVEGAESANGTTWGAFHVVGTYLDGRFTLTETPGPPQPSDDPEVDFSSPCPEPAGGWAASDPATATQAGLEAARSYAHAQPDYAVLWVDDSLDPRSIEERDQLAAEGSEDDATHTILNVQFTGDLDRHEAELRSRWGGPLCVTAAARTEAELRRIQEEVADTAGFLHSSGGSIGNRVELGVIFDDGSLQAELDDRYGEGAVVVTSALRPVG